MENEIKLDKKLINYKDSKGKTIDCFKSCGDTAMITFTDETFTAFSMNVTRDRPGVAQIVDFDINDYDESDLVELGIFSEKKHAEYNRIKTINIEEFKKCKASIYKCDHCIKLSMLTNGFYMKGGDGGVINEGKGEYTSWTTEERDGSSPSTWIEVDAVCTHYCPKEVKEAEMKPLLDKLEKWRASELSFLDRAVIATREPEDFNWEFECIKPKKELNEKK